MAPLDLPMAEEVEKLPVSRVREVLRTLRQTPLRRSKLVVRCGERIVQQKINLGSEQERCNVYEQVAIASLDCNHIALAEWCLQELEERFGRKSRRVMRLRGMLEEGKGNLDKAKEIYERIRSENETDVHAVYRLAAVLKSQGKVQQAITLLEQHLGVFQGSEEVWRELLNLYIVTSHGKESRSYHKAMHACEELILQDPHNHTWLGIYAELQYSAAMDSAGAAQKESLLLARKYFSQSLVANDAENNTRSAWGLWQAARKLDGLSREMNPSEKKENTQMLQWAQKRLAASYQTVGGQPQATAELLLGDIVEGEDES
eukprot:Hpha_TRINITY_DN33857_c0_g1::TRINITY_DN33857_c0_g1_i1::g.27301::m.27301